MFVHYVLRINRCILPFPSASLPSWITFSALIASLKKHEDWDVLQEWQIGCHFTHTVSFPPVLLVRRWTPPRWIHRPLVAPHAITGLKHGFDKRPHILLSTHLSDASILLPPPTHPEKERFLLCSSAPQTHTSVCFNMEAQGPVRRGGGASTSLQGSSLERRQ